MNKWYRFELTAPVAKKDVIKGRYITFLSFALITIVIMLVIQVSPGLILQNINTERVMFSLTMAVLFTILTPAILHPLVLWLGIDKTQFLFMVAVGITLACFIGSSMIFNLVIGNVSNGDAIYRILIVIASFIALFISYQISCVQYSKKDL